MNIPFPSLLNELQQWSNRFDKELFQMKIMRVYTRCRRMGKNELAQKIKTKYKIGLKLTSDSAVAFAIMMNSIKKS